jgi:hypothetical protein
MDKNFKYEFDHLTGILFKYYYGPITIEDISSSWEYAFKNNLIPKDVKGFVLDYRDANFNMELEEHTQISDFYKKNIEVFRNLKIAVITENPNDVVIPILVEYKDDGYFSKLFSTTKAAITWVLD